MYGELNRILCWLWPGHHVKHRVPAGRFNNETLTAYTETVDHCFGSSHTIPHGMLSFATSLLAVRHDGERLLQLRDMLLMRSPVQ